MEQSMLGRLMPELMFMVFDNLRGTSAYGNLRSTCKEMLDLTQKYQEVSFVHSIISNNNHRKSELLCTAVKLGFFEIVVDILSITFLGVEEIEDACISAITNGHPHILSYLLAAHPDVVLQPSSPLLDLSILHDSVESFSIIKHQVLPRQDTMVWKLLHRAAPDILAHELRSARSEHLVTIIADACMLAQKGRGDKLQKLSDALRHINPHHQDTVLKVLEGANNVCAQLCFSLLIDRDSILRGTDMAMNKQIKYTCYTVPLIRKASQYAIDPQNMCDAWLNWDARAFNTLYNNVLDRNNDAWRTQLLNLVVQHDSLRRAKTFIHDLVVIHGSRFSPDALVSVANQRTQTSTIETMLSNGANATWNNNTPIHMACRGLYAESAKVFDLLAAKGATVPESHWKSWLNDAIVACRMDIVKRMLAGKTHDDVRDVVASHLMSNQTSRKTKCSLLRICAHLM